MLMVRADFLLFGYREIAMDMTDIPIAASILLQKGIRVSIINDGCILAKEKDISKIQKILSGRMKISISEPKGLYGAWKRRQHKVATVICATASILTLFLSQCLVWDIRPSGNENIANSDIKARLESCGFSVGYLWHERTLSEVETEFLKRYDDISWININRRGMVAYVSVIEKDIENENAEATNILYSNIVAAYDCVIDEVTVKSGTAMVKPGDSVKKGDLLILGANANGDFSRAEGQIVGRVSDSLSVKVDRKYEKRLISSKKIDEININIFKISINIFKTYGNLTTECDIIDDVKEYSLPNGALLPLSITLRYLPSYTYDSGEYSDEDLVSLAKDRISLYTALMLAESDLVRISTDGEFTEDGYKMWSDILYLTDVGQENIFEITN